MRIKNLPRILLFATVLLSILSISIKAQLDPAFGTDGTVTLTTGTKPMASYILPDGKVLVVSEELFNANNQTYKYHLARFNSDGTPDATYGTNGIVTLVNPADSTNLFDRFFNCNKQADGKMLFVAFQTLYRFNENGTIDTTFSGDGMHSPNVDQQAAEKLAAVIQQPDGKILLAGTILQGGPPYLPYKIFFVRYDLSGNLDQGFGDQGGFIINNVQYATISDVYVQSTGKILTVPQREITQYAFYSPGAINRFNSNGTVDNTFAPVFYAGGTLRSFKFLSDDRFAVAESLSINDQLLRNHRDIVIARYTADGALDTNFGVNGKTEFDVTSAMTDDAIALGEQADGKIIVSGATGIEPNRSLTSGLNLSLVRLNVNGTLSGKYLATNLYYYFYYADEVRIYQGQVLVQPDGKIITVSNKTSGTGDSQILLTRSTNIPFETQRLHGIPYNFLGYNRANPGIYRPSSRNWYFSPSVYPTFFGLSDDIVAPADYVGDFKTDLAVFRPSEGNWYIARESSNPAQNYLTIKWGKTGDIPIPRDYDGDSKADLAVFRPLEGVWYIRNSSDETSYSQKWGSNGDKPVAADYDGDGFDDIAVWRPSDGNWYISRSSDGQTVIAHFGSSGDIPVNDDYDGDGKCDIAVWRPSTGTWFIYRSSDNGYTILNWGLTNDIPTPADYDGDRKADLAVWRPSNRNWYILESTTGNMQQFLFGLDLDLPTQGRY